MLTVLTFIAMTAYTGVVAYVAFRVGQGFGYTEAALGAINKINVGGGK